MALKNKISLWNEGLLFDELKNYHISPIILILICIVGNIVFVPIVSTITWNFKITNNFIITDFYDSILSLLIIVAYLIMRYFIKDYDKLLENLFDKGVLENEDLNIFKKRKGLNPIRITILIIFVIYLFVIGLLHTWYLISIGYTSPNPSDISQFGYVGVLFERTFSTILMSSVLPDFVSLVFGVLIVQITSLSKKVKLLIYTDDNSWGISQIGDFLLKITIITFIFVSFLDVILTIYVLESLKNNIQFTFYQIFPIAFWLVGTWFFALLIFFLPQLSFRTRIKKKKKDLLSNYTKKLNELENKIRTGEIDQEKFQEFQIYLKIKDQINFNSNWSFNYSTIKKLIGISLTPILTQLILLGLNNFVFKIV